MKEKKGRITPLRIIEQLEEHKAKKGLSLKTPVKLLKVQSKIAEGLKGLEKEIKAATVSEKIEFGKVTEPDFVEGELALKIGM